MPKTIIDEQDDEGEDNAEEESNNNDLIAMNSPSRRASRPATHSLATHQPMVREILQLISSTVSMGPNPSIIRGQSSNPSILGEINRNT